MSDPRNISGDALEILVTRELRKAGVEPLACRRHWVHTGETEFEFDLTGRLRAYEHSWTALIGCSNRGSLVSPAAVEAVRERADEARCASALLCTTTDIAREAVERAGELRVALLQVVDAQQALVQVGVVQPGPLPAWLPEFALQLVTTRDAAQLLEADEPELILRELRATAR